MTRIIAGTARGRRLVVPPSGTRPTSDRAREALFNTLAADVVGAAVLDLYAGSGAVGLEAISRGARSAVFVESARPAAQVLRANIQAVGLPGALLVTDDVRRWVRSASPTAGPFELVFADPPYALEDAELGATLLSLADGGLLAPEAILVVERSARDLPWQWPGECITAVRQKRYGEAVLWYGRAR